MMKLPGNLRGHAPVSCPTLAALRLADFSHVPRNVTGAESVQRSVGDGSQVRCMRCGTLGHPNCGMPPKADAIPTQPVHWSANM